MIRTILIELTTILATIAYYAVVAPGVVEDTVDAVEINYLHDEQGRPVFTQAIYLDWNCRESVWDVVAWRLLKSPAAIPVKRGDWYEATWHDGETLRRLKCRQVIFSYTTHDPEVKQRDRLPMSERRELGTVRARAK